MNKYMKFGAQVLAAILAAIYPAVTDGDFTIYEQINALIIGLGAVSVLGAGNLPEGVWKYTKFYVSVVTAVFVAIASLLSGGITGAEWVQVALAGLGAAGVISAPGPTVLSTGRHRAAD